MRDVRGDTTAVFEGVHVEGASASSEWWLLFLWINLFATTTTAMFLEASHAVVAFGLILAMMAIAWRGQEERRRGLSRRALQAGPGWVAVDAGLGFRRERVARVTWAAERDGTGQLRVHAVPSMLQRPSSMGLQVNTPTVAMARAVAEAIGTGSLDQGAVEANPGTQEHRLLAWSDGTRSHSATKAPLMASIFFWTLLPGLVALALGLALGPSVLAFQVGGALAAAITVGSLALRAVSHAGGAGVTGVARVGADGLQLTWGADSRFVSVSELADVEYESPASDEGRVRVRVSLRDGTRLDLDLRDGTAAYDPPVGRAELGAMALVAQLNDAMAAHATAAEVPTEMLAHLSPNGQPVDDWLAQLRAPKVEGRFREAAWGSDVLWRVVEQAGRSPTHRAAAAAALAPGLDPSGRQRLRVAAGGTSMPRLRVALDAAAAGDDSTLREALGELAAEEQAGEAARGTGAPSARLGAER
jgi:hypothetical protein